MKTNKFISILYSVNQVFFILTLGLFTTIWLGFLAEIVLGAIQIISSLLLIIYWRAYSKKMKEYISMYWGITILYLSLWFVDWNVIDSFWFYIICIGIIPMTIAFYFLWILRTLKNERKEDVFQKIGMI